MFGSYATKYFTYGGGRGGVNLQKVSISFHVNWLWRIPYSPSGRKDKNIGSPITQVRATYDGGGVDDDEDDDEDWEWDGVADCLKIGINLHK